MTEHMQDPAANRLAAGRARAAEMQPYLATGLYAMKPVKTTGVPTFGVDKRWRMYWNPDFCLSMSVEECAGVWLHEAGHLLRTHRERFEATLEPAERHPLWNGAADAAINADLRADGVSLPAVKAYFPERIPGAEEGMTTEQMYRLLLNTPAADKVTKQKAEMILIPGQVRYDYGTQKVVARLRRRILTGTTTVTILDADGTEVQGSAGPVLVADERTAAFDLTGTPLPPGEYAVTLTCGSESATAALRITYPVIDLRPDHVSRGYTAPFRIVVAGNDTRFSAEATTVTLLDRDGNEAAGAVSNVEVISKEYLTFDLGVVVDGNYVVEVNCGGEVSRASLPVGLPYLDLTPPNLPSGHGTPYPISALGDDIVFGQDTEVEILDPQLLMSPVPGAVANLIIVNSTTLNFAVDVQLPDGQYLVVATSGGEQAVATLTVGGDSNEPGDGGGGGSQGESGEGDSGESDDTDADGEPGDGQGQGNAQGEAGDDDGMLPQSDCGSGATGGKRPWELAEGEDDNDGSVDAGRGNLIREQVARQIREHAKTRGNLPGGWTRWADSILKPQVDWRKELKSVVRREIASKAGMRDYTYQRPSRRASALPNVVLPAMRSPRPPKVRVVVDTSGSVSDKMLGQAIGDMEALLRQIRGDGGDSLDIIACDAAAAEMKSVRDMKNLTALDGGGGTDMRVGIKAAAEATPAADMVIVFTDGETPWPTEPPSANPRAKYVAVLLAGDTSDHYEVPDFMHKIVVDDAYLRNNT